MAGFASCTLLGSRDLVQCTTNEDCGGAVCADGLCQRTSLVTPGDAGQDGALQRCERTSDCAQGEGPKVCRAGACDPLTQFELCPITSPTSTPDLGDDDTLIVASYGDEGENVFSEPATEAIRYAVEQIRTVGGALRPRLVVLHCKKNPRNPSQLGDVSKFLIDHRIPLLFGQFGTKELEELSSDIPKQLALWSTLGNARSLQPAGGDAGDLRWFFVDEIANLAPAFQPVFDRALARRRGDAGTADARVAVVAESPSSEVAALVAALEANLVVNGAPLGDASPLVATFLPSERSEIAAFAPDVAIALGGDAILDSIAAVEQSHRPAWIVGPRTKFNVQSILNQGGDPSFRARFYGVDFGGDPSAYADYYTGKLSKTVNKPFDNLYDATFAVFFASAAALSARGVGRDVTSQDMNDALGVLQPKGDGGTPVRSFASDPSFQVGFQLATSRSPFRLVGTTGAWHFEVARHTRREMGSSIFCFLKGSRDVIYYVPLAEADARCE